MKFLTPSPRTFMGLLAMRKDSTDSGIAWVWKSRIGEFSLRLAIAGVVLPGAFAVLFAGFRNAAIIAACLFLCANLELLALGLGITRRRTPTGMAGLVISSFVLMTIAGSVAFFFLTHPSRM